MTNEDVDAAGKLDLFDYLLFLLLVLANLMLCDSLRSPSVCIVISVYSFDVGVWDVAQDKT